MRNVTLATIFFGVLVCIFVLLYDGIPSKFIFLGLRVPREILAFATGGILGLAGGVYQSVLRNPLADPYILGVASSSLFGSTLGVLIFPPLKIFFSLAFCAFALFLILWMGRFLVLPERLVLGGVVLNAFFISATLFLYALANPFELLEAIAYTLGYVPYLSLAKSLIILGFVIGSFSILVPRSKNLDALSLGDDMAHSLGIQPVRERILQLAFSSVPVALCVSYCGPIGFLGIVFPHLVRFTVSGANRFVLKFSFLWGGFFLVLSDFFARKILSPSELPVGTITALGLSPIFLWVLRRVSWERRWF